MRYTEHPVSLDFDSRQDEEESPCGECQTWMLDELLQPRPDLLERCPEGVIGNRGPVCAECAEMLRGEVERAAAE